MSDPGGSIQQPLILNSEMHLKFFQYGGPIQQLLILNSEMHLKNFQIWGGPFHGMGPFTRFDTFPILLCASP